MTHVVLRPVAGVAADGATVAEPVTGLTVACVEGIPGAAVRGDGAASLAVLAVLAKAKRAVRPCVGLVAWVAPIRPGGESAVERVAGARERHGAVADATDHQGGPRGEAK